MAAVTGLSPGGSSPLITPGTQILDRSDVPSRLIIPRWMFLVLAIFAQAILTRAMMDQPRLGFLQALVLVALIGWSVLKRTPVVTLCVMAYIPCAEIVWRQVRAPIPYQLAPYAMTAGAVLLVLTLYNRLTRPGRTALYYFLLLVPSTVVTISVTGSGSRQLIAFALAGPLAMATLVILFSQITIEPWLYRRLLWIVIVSGIGPLAAALTTIEQYVATNGGLVFDDESNFVTSGGFGPVQVSSMMGLTVLAAVLVYLAERDGMAKLVAIAVGFGAAILSFLTFSRGGMTATALALAAFALSQTRDPRSRGRVIMVVIVVFLVGYFVLVPRINDFTQGAFEERFSDTSSGRTELATNDLQVFEDNIAFGVGPGLTRYNRIPYDVCQLRADKCSKEGSSHTEFTRMLGEHGLAGAIAILLIISLVVQAWRRAGPSRPITVTFLTWAIAQMFYANFRVVGIAWAFAFAFIKILPADIDPDAPGELEAPVVALGSTR
ncbi:MAG: Lipid core-O-antigen ligase-like enyme [Ilumatobacteraceae bacterium]|nr:Lipid core-O-antigen ligase-like enyme [Ilumatobacteraceae bacterium]